MKLQNALMAIVQELNLRTENDEIFCQKVAQKMKEQFSGYSVNIPEIFSNKIPNSGGSFPIEFQEIPFISYCIHHMTPILGTITISYTPSKWIVGLSKIIECTNAFTKRLQLQENLTVEIANAIFENLQAKRVYVEISAKHYCMQKSANDHLPTIKTHYLADAETSGK